jgi:hypothetical protein
MEWGAQLCLGIRKSKFNYKYYILAAYYCLFNFYLHTIPIVHVSCYFLPYCQVVITVELSKWNRKDLTIWKIDNGYACVSGIFRVCVRSNKDGRCNHIEMYKF